MKKTILFIGIAIILKMLAGCADQPADIPANGLYNVYQYGSAWNPGCCTESRNIMFSDSGSGMSYYYAGVEKDRRLLAYGNYITATAPCTSLALTIDVDYSQIDTSAYYNFNVYACNSSSDVGS